MIKQLMKQDSMEIGSKSRFNKHPALRFVVVRYFGQLKARSADLLS